MCDTNADKKFVPSSEMVTSGARLSPYEDFKLRSLSAIDGLWSKLLYVAQLRSSQGQYEHWGHSRTYGQQRSQEALAQIHSELYLEVLRAPLRELIPEGITARKMIAEQVSGAGERLIPANPGRSVRHFNSIVLAVRLLSDDRLVLHPSAA